MKLIAILSNAYKMETKVSAQIPQPNTSGYLFDGVCDGLAVLFVLLGLGLGMLRESTTPGRHKTR